MSLWWSKGAIALAALVVPMKALAQTEIEVWVVAEPGEANVYEALAEEYNAAHPETRFMVVRNASDLFSPALIPAISAGEGPELFQFGVGPGQPKALIEGGLVADLMPYAEQYGWVEKIPPAVWDLTSSDGKLWAVGNEVESTAMFYNSAIFEELGLAVPTTWAEMEAVVQALKDAGHEAPIALAGADRWPVSHVQSMMWGRFAGPEGESAVMFSNGAWDDAPFLAATERFVEMAEAGWFGPSPVASNYAETMERFWAGEVPMTFTGSFAIGSGVAAAGDRIGDFGVFQVPPFEEGQQVYPTEGIGSAWYVRANSGNKDAIADFIDFMMFDPESRVTLVEGGRVPVGPVSDAMAAGSPPQLMLDLARLNDESRENGTIYAFIDAVTPAAMTSVTYDGLQALLIGQMSPQEFVDGVEAAWLEAKAAGETLAPPAGD